MKPNFRICPQCSTRNRLDKEFCVKCGEPLEGIVAGDPGAEKTAKPKGKVQFVVTEAEGASPLVPFIAVLLALGVAFGAWRYLQATAPVEIPATASRPIVPGVAAAAPTPVLPVPGVQEYSDGVAALRRGDFQAAVALLRSATEAVPTNADYALAFAEALEKSGSGADALAEYERAAGLEPTSSRYTGEWAKALNRAGRNVDAVRVYQQALQMSPEHLPNLREVVNLLTRADNFAAARPYLETIVRLQPDDLVPKQDLARALEATNDLQGAAEQYQQILEAMPNAEMSRARLAEVYMKGNRSTDALTVINEGLTANPESALLFREKGRVHDRISDNAGAIAAYREYLRLAPTASDARVFKDRLAQLSAAGGQ